MREVQTVRALSYPWEINVAFQYVDWENIWKPAVNAIWSYIHNGHQIPTLKQVVNESSSVVTKNRFAYNFVVCRPISKNSSSAES